MADELTTKTLVKEVAVKEEDGTFSTPLSWGVSFQDVADVSRTGATQWTLAQMMDSYLDFLKTNNFIAYGTDVPTNSHVRLWIDTAHDNQNNPG
jgi:hypothetical protein